MIRPAVLLLVCAGLFACDHLHEDHDHDVGHEHTHEHDVAADSDAALALDSGRKWASDATTRAGMRRMQDIARSALDQGQVREPNAQLAQRLETELARVVRECTMQGPSHQMLHLYLAQLTDVIGALKSEDAAVARDGFERLNPTLQKFDSFFE